MAMRFLIPIVAVLTIAFFGVAAPAFAGLEVNTAPGAVLVDGEPAPGLAVHGFDVVAYFTEARPVQGEAKFAAIHNDATYRFASKANLEAFKANPDHFVPAYGGYCAYGVSVGAKFDGDPRFWKVMNGKLYLNLDEGIQQAWLKDVPGAIEKADANWPALAGKSPAEIN
ncbi:MAG TPA: YHS domain-containing (seleno)protein [Methyloceanibacter sp.]|nr:YHS domain-containing (seleno)protein [Methyloceanibacter sp.]